MPNIFPKSPIQIEDDEFETPDLNVRRQPNKDHYYHVMADRINLTDANGNVNPDRLETILNQQAFMKAIRNPKFKMSVKSRDIYYKKHYATQSQDHSLKTIPNGSTEKSMNEFGSIELTNYPVTTRKKKSPFVVAFGCCDVNTTSFGKYKFAQDLNTKRQIRHQRTTLPEIEYKQLKGRFNRIAPGGRKIEAGMTAKSMNARQSL